MKYIYINEKTFFYPVSSKLVHEIEQIVDDYFSKIYSYENNTYDIILLLAESREFLKNTKQCDELLYTLVSDFREHIYSGYYYNRFGLAGGLCNTASMIRFYNMKTGYYTKFLSSINKLIISNIDVQLTRLSSKPQLSRKTSDYDIISGISGVTHYLINFCDKELLEKISDYLCDLVEPIQYQGKKIPGWFIDYNNVFPGTEKDRFVTGQINYGMAHGITGILSALLKLAQKKINVNRINRAMKNIVTELEKMKRMQQVTYFPEIITPEEYLQNEYYISSYQRMSWCYGSITILYVLYNYYNYLNDIKHCNYILAEMHNIAKQGNSCWKLESPIVCHGYAGLAHLFKLLYKKTGDYEFTIAFNQLLSNICEIYNKNSRYGFLDVYYKQEKGMLKRYVEDKNSFLEGGSGIIAVLLGFITEQDGVSELLGLDF